MADESLFDGLLQKLIGSSTTTKTNETLDVNNLIKQLVSGVTNQATTGVNTSTQSSTADVSNLQKVFGQQQAGITPEALAAIFREGSKAVPGLVASTANAVGARSGQNSALATALTDLNTNLTNSAATQSQSLLNASGNTAAQIAELTKSLTTAGTSNQNTAGTTSQNTDTNQGTKNIRNTDTDSSNTINAKSTGITAGTALLGQLLTGGSGGGSGVNLGSIGGWLGKLFGNSSGSTPGLSSSDLGNIFGDVGYGSTTPDVTIPDYNYGDLLTGWADGGLVPVQTLSLSDSSKKKEPNTTQLLKLLDGGMPSSNLSFAQSMGAGTGSSGSVSQPDSYGDGNTPGPSVGAMTPEAAATVNSLLGLVSSLVVSIAAPPGTATAINALLGKPVVPTLSNSIASLISQITAPASSGAASGVASPVGSVSVSGLTAAPADDADGVPGEGTATTDNPDSPPSNPDGNTGPTATNSVDADADADAGTGSGGDDGSGGGAGATGWKDGGYIPRVRGDAGGTKDVIPTKLPNGKVRPALTGGEFIIPTDVVKLIGAQSFQDLVNMYHTPVKDQEAPGEEDSQ